MGAVLALPKGLGGTNVGKMLRVVGLPSERTEKQLSGSADQVVRTIVSILEDLVSRTMTKRSSAEFVSTRAEVFPSYFAAMRALGDLVGLVVPRHTIERLVAEAFSELEHDLRELGVTTFGSDLRDRGLFTVWTLRKISDLAKDIDTAELAKGLEDHDAEVAMKFATHAVWARFHVDCLVQAMRLKKPIYPEVVDNVADGLRAAVNAYAWIRQAVDLRTGTAEPDLSPVEWAEEDQILLDDSMRDMANESVQE